MAVASKRAVIGLTVVGKSAAQCGALPSLIAHLMSILTPVTNWPRHREHRASVHDRIQGGSIKPPVFSLLTFVSSICQERRSQRPLQAAFAIPIPHKAGFAPALCGSVQAYSAAKGGRRSTFLSLALALLRLPSGFSIASTRSLRAPTAPVSSSRDIASSS